MDVLEFLQLDHYNKVVSSAKECLKTYGTLHWCRGKICACMGCANRFMTEECYHEAISIPEVQALVPFPEHSGKNILCTEL